MSKELVISANRHETKVAILEDDQLVEVYFQRANEYSLAGSIHKGRVTRVLPGMQSAFVDLGLERDTFLYVSDFLEEGEDFDRVLPAREERQERPSRQERVEKPAPVEMMPELAALESGSEPKETDEPEESSSAPSGAPPASEQTVAAPVTVAAPSAAHDRRPERRDDADDRRGRRSRRRRNRGRGFPDSKYASDVPNQAGPSPEPVVRETRTEAPVADNEYEFPVLPGESLAKYRHPSRTQEHARTAASGSNSESAREEPNGSRTQTAQRSNSGGTSDEFRDDSPDVDADAHHELFAGRGAAAAREPEGVAAPTASAEPESNAFAEDTEPAPEFETVADVSPVTEHTIPSTSSVVAHEETNPEAEAVADIIAIAREGGAFSAEDLAESPVPALELLEAEALDIEEEPELTEAETLEIEIADLDALESEGAESDTAERPSREAETKPQQAHVREQGGRYGQRGPRRMRRRMRGGAAAPADVPTAPRSETQQRSGPRVDRESSDRGDRNQKAGVPSITDLLKEGQEILVQIAKEPLGQKGARITSHIALPGRYVVFMPTLEHMGVSRKIASDEERLRLKKILQSHRSTVQGGFIVRTAGEGKTEEEILADMNFLANLWQDIRQKAEKKPAPLLLHHDLDIVQRILRDQVTDHFKSIWVDSEDAYESILRFVQRFQPALVSRVKLYTRNAPIFDAFNITQELEKALRPKVWLKSGGYIVINQTEALVAIDVNTGKYVGKSNRLEDTIVKTNTEAVKEIVRQIRLRDLGGIIVVDFIDMDERKNRQKVMQALEEAMRADKAPNKILQFNDFGLVAITRKRVKQSLERALCSPCPYCEGAGYVKSVQTTVSEIVQEAQKIAKAVEGKDVMLRVHPDVAKFLKSSDNKYLEELEEVLRRPVLVKGDPALHQDKFDLA